MLKIPLMYRLVVVRKFVLITVSESILCSYIQCVFRSNQIKSLQRLTMLRECLACDMNNLLFANLCLVIDVHGNDVV